MKKILMFLCSVTLVFGIVATASAIPFKKLNTYKANEFTRSIGETLKICPRALYGFNPYNLQNLWIKPSLDL